MTYNDIIIVQAMDMACWGLIPRFWVKDKGFKEDDAVWGENAQKSKPADPPPEATELREGAFVAKILCDDREEEMEENMEQVSPVTCAGTKLNDQQTLRTLSANLHTGEEGPLNSCLFL